MQTFLSKSHHLWSRRLKVVLPNGCQGTSPGCINSYGTFGCRDRVYPIKLIDIQRWQWAIGHSKIYQSVVFNILLFLSLQINKYRLEIDTITQKLNKTEQNYVTCDRERERVQKELLDANRKVSDISILLQTTQEEKKSVDSQLKSVCGELERYKQDNETYNTKAVALQEEILTTHKQFTKIESSYQRSVEKEERLESEIEDSKEKIQTLEQELNAARNRINDLEGELNRTRNKLEKEETSLEQYTQESSKLNDMVRDYESKLSQLKSSNDENKTLKEEITSLKTHVSRLELELRAEHNNLVTSQDQYDQARLSNDNLSNEVSRLQRQLRSLGGDKEKVTSEYQTAIHEKDSEIEKLKSSLRTVERENEATKKTVDEKTTVLETFTRERVVIVAEIQDIMKRLRNVETSHVKVRDQLIQEYTAQSDYDRAVFDIKIIIEKIEREFQSRYDIDKQQLDAIDQEKKDRNQQSKEIDDLRRKLDSLQQVCTGLEKDKNTIREEKEAVVIRCDGLNKDVETQQTTIKELTDKIRYSETLITEYESKTTTTEQR